MLRRRRMVRHYDATRPIPAAVRERLLSAALRAPSAGFTQGWGFLVLEEPVDRELFWQVTADPHRPPDRWLAGMRSAPLLILCFSHRDAYLDRYAEPDKGWTDRDPGRWTAPYWEIDVGFAALLMLLAAVDARLGACFFGVPAPRVDEVRRAFGVPEAFHPTGVVSVGYPAPDHRSPSLRRGRRDRDEVVHYGRWGGAAP